MNRWRIVKERALGASPLRLHVVLAALVLFLALVFRLRSVEASMPYWGHVDEKTWADIAVRMVQKGDLNPHRFRKPSLAVYLMATSMRVGKAVGPPAWSRDPREEPPRSRGYRAAPSIMIVTRSLFAVLSVVALGAAGMLGYRMLQRPLAPRRRSCKTTRGGSRSVRRRKRAA